MPLDKCWLLSPSGTPHSLAQRAGTKGFCQDPAVVGRVTPATGPEHPAHKHHPGD